MTLSSHGTRPIEPISCLKVLLDSRLQYDFLQGLIDIVAFLVQKVWQNNRISIREIPRKFPRYLLRVCSLLTTTLEPEMLESRWRTLKTRIIA